MDNENYLQISDDLAMAIGNFLVHIEYASIFLVQKVLPAREKELAKKEIGGRLKAIDDAIKEESIVLNDQEKELFNFLKKNNEEMRRPLVHGIYENCSHIQSDYGSFRHILKKEIKKTGKELNKEGFQFSEKDIYTLKEQCIGFSASYIREKTLDLSGLLEVFSD